MLWQWDINTEDRSYLCCGNETLTQKTSIIFLLAGLQAERVMSEYTRNIRRMEARVYKAESQATDSAKQVSDVTGSGSHSHRHHQTGSGSHSHKHHQTGNGSHSHRHHQTGSGSHSLRHHLTGSGSHSHNGTNTRQWLPGRLLYCVAQSLPSVGWE